MIANERESGRANDDACARATTAFPQVLILLMAFWFGSGSAAIDMRRRVESSGLEGDAKDAALVVADRMDRALVEHCEELVVLRQRLGTAMSEPAFTEDRLRLIVDTAFAAVSKTEDVLVDDRFALRAKMDADQWSSLWKDGAPR